MSNTAPNLTELATSVTFAENTVNAVPQFLDPDVEVTDPENNFDGGKLVVSGLLAEDIVSINSQGFDQGEIGFAGGNVTFGNTLFGAATGGAGDDLVVTFNGDATRRMIERLIENLTYANSSDAPHASRTLTVKVKDAAGDGTGQVPITVNIAPDDDGPATAPGGNVFPTLSGTPKVGVALNGAIAALSDPDGLTSNGNPLYLWQSSVDGSTGWTNITPLATSSSFTPSANEAGKYLRVGATVKDDQGYTTTFFGASVQPAEAADGVTATIDRSGSSTPVDIDVPNSSGNWKITTGSGADDITTGSGKDVVTTGAGNDFVQTNGGNDTVNLGGDDDTFEGGSGAGDDLVIGGAGTDTATYPSTTAGVTIDLGEIDRSSNPAVAALLNDPANQVVLSAAGYAAPPAGWAHLPVAIATGSEIGTDVLLSFENATGGSGNDSLTGNALANIFDGGLGTDTVIFHGAAADGIAAQSGTTLIVNGSGGGDGTDTLIDVEKVVFQNGTAAPGDDTTITVASGNAILHGVDDNATAVEAGGVANGTPGTNPPGNVLANDINLDQVAGNAVADDVKRVTAARVSGGTDVAVLSGLTIDGTLVDVTGLYGILKIAEDGTWQYIVNQSAVDHKNVGDTPLIDTFVYTADDGSGFLQVQVLNITITPVNDAASFTGQSTGDVTEKGGVANGTAGVASANGDLDAADVDSAATFVVQSNLSKAYGTFSIDVNGVWTYTLDDTNSAVQGLSAGQTLHDQFNVATADGTTKLMDITIHGADDTATITTASVTTSETNLSSLNSFLVGSTVTIVDVDTDDAAAPHPYVANSGSVTVVGPPPPSDTLEDLLSFDPVSGQVSYDRSAFNWLQAGQSVEYTITFQVQSGNDAPQTHSLTITINGQNDAPVLTSGAHPALTTISEHDTANPGQTVASFRGPVSDADFGATTGIAVTGLNNGNGHWEYRIGAGAWTPFGAVSDGAALLLRDTDLVRFVPNNTSGTSASLSYRAWDGISGSAGGSGDASTNGGTTAFSGATDTATITVLAVNDAPTAADDAGAATEAGGTLNGTAGTNAGGNVLANDNDVDSGPPTVSAVHTGALEGLGTAGALSVGLAGAHGTLTLNADGSYAYVVNQNDAVVQALKVGESTTDSFNYTVRDPAGLTDTAVLTITINGANDAPVAANDTGSATEKGGTLNGSGGNDASGNVLSNDTDVDNASLTVSAVRIGGTEGAGAAGAVGGTTAGAHGTLTLGANGAYTYTVNEADSAVQALKVGESVTDTFNYTVSDGVGGLTDTAVLTITINGANDAPTATGLTQSLAVTEDSTSAPLGIVVTEVDAGDTITATLRLSSPSAGSLTTTGGGSYTQATGVWTITGSLASVNAALASVAFVPVPNSNAGVTIATHIEDASGVGPANGTITLSVTPVNDAPVGVNDAGSATEKGGTLNGSGGNGASGNVLTNDTDIDTLNSALTVTAVRRGGTEGAGAAGTVGGTTNGQRGTLTLGANGAYTYTVDENDSAVQALKAGETIVDRFNYTVSDGSLTDIAVLTITINGANDAPTATGLSQSLTVTEDTPSAPLAIVVTEVDAGDTVTARLTLSDPSAGALSTAGGGSYTPATGVWTISGSLASVNAALAAVTFVPATNSNTAVTIATHIEDATGAGPADGAIAVTVTPVNDAPVGVNDSSASAGALAATEKGGTLNGSGGNDATGNVLTNDTDVDNAGLTVSAVRSGGTEGAGTPGTLGGATAGAHGTLTLGANGVYTYTVNETDSAVQALAAGETLTDSFNYTVTDGALTDTAVLTITINGANDIASITTSSVLATETNLPSFNFFLVGDKVTITDVDADDAAAPTGYVPHSGSVSATGPTPPSDTLADLLTFDPATGAVTYDRSAFNWLSDGQCVVYTISFQAQSGDDAPQPQSLTVTIHGENDAPVLTSGTHPALTTINEHDVDNPGQTVASFRGPVSDADFGAPKGIAVVGLESGNGHWEFSTDGGVCWIDFGTVSDDSARLLRDTDLVRFVPNDNAPTSASLDYRAWDGTTGEFGCSADTTPSGGTTAFSTATDTATITVLPVNDPPFALDNCAAAVEASGYFNGTPGSPATGHVLTNDSDDGGQPALVVSAVRAGSESGSGLAGLIGGMLAGAHGTLIMNDDGSFTYLVDEDDPDVQALNVCDFTTDTFTYTARDLGNLTDKAELVITIWGRNDNAVITGTTGGTVLEAGGTLNATLNIPTAFADLLATDVDNTYDAWQAVAAGAGTTNQYGTYGLTADGVWTYTLDNTDPEVQALNVGDWLSDSFTLYTEDGTPQLISVTIDGANDAPVGVDDTSASAGATAATEKGGTFNGSGGANATGDVLANDTDVDDPTWSFVVAAVRTGAAEGSGTAGTVNAGLVGAHGTLTLDSDGSYVYVVDENDPLVQVLNVGGIITDSFNYTVQDPGGLTDTAVLTITINGANDAPVGVDDTSASPGAIAATEKGGTANGTGGNNAGGNVLANDTDVDNTTPSLVVTGYRTGGNEAAGTAAAALGAALVGAHGSLTLQASGAYTYVVDENDAIVQALNVGQFTTDTFNYTVQDPAGLIDWAVLTVTINGANDAPVAANDSSASVGAVAAAEQGGTLNGSGGVNGTGNVLANDADIDDANVTLAVTAYRTGGAEGSGTPAAAVGAALAGLHGTLTILAGGSYTYVVSENDGVVQALNVGQFTTDTFNYTVGDPGGLIDWAVLTVTINGANDAPVGVDDSSASAGALAATEKGGTSNGSGGNNAGGNVLTNDTDVDDASRVVTAYRTGATEGSGTAAASVGAALIGAHGTLTLNADGSYTYVVNENDAVVQALNVGQFTTDSFNYTIGDPGGLIDTAVLTITINGANDAPVGVDDTSASPGALAATEKGGTLNGASGVNAAGNVLANDTDVDDTARTVTAYRTGTTEGAGTAAVSMGAALIGAHGTLTLQADGSYSYVVNENDGVVQGLNVGQSTTDSFNYTFKDPAGLTDTALLTITINGANDAPVGADDTSASAGAGAATEKGGNLNATGGVNATGNVLTNDTDVDNLTPVLTVASYRTGATEGSGTAAASVGSALIGAHGTLTLQANGSYTYVVSESDAAVQALNVGGTITDSFNYTVRDPGGLTDTALLTITINGANDAPVGVDDTSASAGAVGATEKGGTSNGSGGSNAGGSVLTNDTDADDASRVVTAYRTGATEGSGTAAGAMGSALIGAHGTLTLQADGSYSYVVNENDAVVQALNAGQFTTDSFNYTVQDPGGLTDTAVLTITINGADDAPVGVDDTSAGAVAATEKGGNLNGAGGVNGTGNVLANDTDIDNATSTLAVTAYRTGGAEGSGTPAASVGAGLVGAHGTLTILANGAYTYVVNESDGVVQALNVGQSTIDTFNYTVRDPAGLTDTAVLTITINGANDAPVGVDETSASAGAVAATEKGGTLNGSGGNNASGNVLTNDTDVDNPAASLSVLSFRFGASEGFGVVGTLGTGLAGARGTLTLNTDGSYSYVVNENDAAVQALNAGQFTTDTFNYTVTDGISIDTAVLTIIINGADDAPVGVNDTSTSAGAIAATEKGGTNNGSGGNNASGNVRTNDTDVDNTTASLEVTEIRTGGTEGAGISGTPGVGLLGQHGTLTLGTNGSYTYVVNEDDTAVQELNVGGTITDSFNYTVRDPGGLTDTAVLTVTIGGANDAATITGPASGSVTEAGGVANGTTNTPQASGNLDADDFDNADDTWQTAAGVATANGHGTFSMTAAGLWTYTLNNTLAAVQALNASSTPLNDSFTVTTVDGTTQTVSITINGANDAPVVGAPLVLVAAKEDTDRTITKAELLANTTDVDNANLVVTELALVGGGTLIDNLDGTWTFKPAPNDDTQVSFTYKVGDTIAAAIATSATMDITPVNDTPESQAAIAVGNEDTTVSGSVVATDVEGQALTYGLVTQAANGVATVNPNGSYSYKPNANFNGTDSFSYSAFDGATSSVATVTVQIGSVNDAPVNLVPGTLSVESGLDIPLVDLSISDPDAGAGTMTTTLSVTHGKLSVGALGGVQVAGSGTASVTLTGTLAQLNTALGSQNLVYHTDASFAGSDTLTIATSDNGNSGTGGPLTDTDQVSLVSQHFAGTPGNDTYQVLPGYEQIDAGGGIDTITLNFKLTDATFAWSGNEVIVTTANSRTVLTGFEVFQFADGTVNNNDGDVLVDDLYYYATYRDVWNTHADADTHYHSTGWHEWRDPSAFFSTSFYLAVNADVKASGADPLIQFHNTGWTQGRQPSTTFDVQEYLKANPDIAAANVDPLAHFMQFGAGEGRQPVALTELLAENGFDYVYYLAHNPDVAASHVDPFQHFQTVGWKEGRNPNALFDTKGYLATYQDVAKVGINPLDHYHQFGWKEGRDPSVGFDSSQYRFANPDIAAANIDPLKHFLDFGIHEGRSPQADGVWG